MLQYVIFGRILPFKKYINIDNITSFSNNLNNMYIIFKNEKT
jgi:hypothetical protein